MGEKAQNRVVMIVFAILWMLAFWCVLNAKGQDLHPVCAPGNSTETCLALLDQKSQEIDNHIANTDTNVNNITGELKALNKSIQSMEDNEAWEREIWGAMVLVATSGLGIVHFFRKKRVTA